MAFSPGSVNSGWRNSLVRRLIPAIAGGAARWLGAAREYLVEYRKAKTAEDLHRRLSAMSAEVLAKAGLKRSEIASEVKRRLYGP